MPLENKQIAAMAAWTLEDFQNDPLGAMAQIRELAASHLSLQRERDAAGQNRCEVTEVCPHCESEITMTWDVAQAGYKAFCPVCGERLMLCDMCLHPEGGGGNCDYDNETDTCKHNRGGET